MTYRHWNYEQNKERIKILKEYEWLIDRHRGKKRLVPKQAWDVISKKYNIQSRKTIYNWKRRFEAIPLNLVSR